jgi:hypothetical protein
MGKKSAPGKSESAKDPQTRKNQLAAALSALAGKPSALLDTRPHFTTVYCGDCLEQLKNLPDQCVDLIYIDPWCEEIEQSFNSNRTVEQLGEVFWGETREKRAFEGRRASTQAYIDYMRPRCVERL